MYISVTSGFNLLCSSEYNYSLCTAKPPCLPLKKTKPKPKQTKKTHPHKKNQGKQNNNQTNKKSTHTQKPNTNKTKTDPTITWKHNLQSNFQSEVCVEGWIM